MLLNILQCIEQNSTIKNCPVQNVNNTCILVAQSCPTLCDPMDYKPTRRHRPWNSPSKSTEVCSPFPLEGLFPIYESNPGLLHCRWIHYHLSHQGSQSLKNPVLATSLSLFTFMHWGRKWQPTPVFLPGESQGQGSLVGCHLWGHTESDTTEATWQQQQSTD